MTTDWVNTLGWSKPAQVVREALVDRLANGKHLNEEELSVYASMAGRTERTIYRWQRLILAAQGGTPPPSPADDRTVLEKLFDGEDRSVFEFDALMVAMVYAVDENMTRLHDDLEAEGCDVPSLATLSRKWARVAPMIKNGARFGLKNRTKKMLYLRRPTRPDPLEYFHWDATELDIDVLGPDGKLCKPHFTCGVDPANNFCPAILVLPYKAGSTEVKGFLASAVEVRPSAVDPKVNVGGQFGNAVFDNAGEYTSEANIEALAELGGTGRAIAVHSPEQNAQAEITIKTLQRLMVTGIGGERTKAEGRTGEALSTTSPERAVEWDAFVDHCFRQLHRYDYELKQACLGDRTPFEARRDFEPDPVPIERLVPLWIPVTSREGKRKVHTGGGFQIRIRGRQVWFNSPELAELGLLEKFIYPAMLPHDPTRAAVRDEYGRYICMAYADQPKEGRVRITSRRRATERAVLAAHATAQKLRDENAAVVNESGQPNVALAARRAGLSGGESEAEDVASPAPAGGQARKVPPVERFNARKVKNSRRGPAAARTEDDARRKALELSARAAHRRDAGRDDSDAPSGADPSAADGSDGREGQ